MSENVTGRLQHMGALRPDLPIEAMIKIKMVAVEAKVMVRDEGGASGRVAARVCGRPV